MTTSSFEDLLGWLLIDIRDISFSEFILPRTKIGHMSKRFITNYKAMLYTFKETQ